MAKPKILLVDSDEKSLSMMTISLKKADFNVTQARDGEEAWELMRTSRPDLIISDTKMPRMDGFTFCGKVKDDQTLRAIPFIFLTREKSVDDKIRGLELGVDDYLTKPIYLKEVLARVRLLLEKREKEKVDFVPQEPQFAGSLSDMGVVDLIQTMEMGQKTGVIYLQRAEFKASVSFEKGRVVDAKVANVVGEQAIYKLLLWGEGSFRIDFRNIEGPETVTMSTQGLIMEGMRRIDELVRIREQLPPLESLLAIDSQVILEEHPDQFPEKIETILSEFTGTKTLQQVVDLLPYDDLECLEIIAKLYFQGFLMPVMDGGTSSAVLAADELKPQPEEPLFNFAPPEEDDTAEHVFDPEEMAAEDDAGDASETGPGLAPPIDEESAADAVSEEAEAPAPKPEAAPRKAKPKQGKVIFLKGAGGAATARKPEPEPESEPEETSLPQPEPVKPPEPQPEPPETPAQVHLVEPPAPPVVEAPEAEPPPAPAPAARPAATAKPQPKPARKAAVKPAPLEMPPVQGPASQPAATAAAAAAATAQPSQPARSRLPLIAAGVALVLALGGGGAWFALNGSGSSAGIVYKETAVRLGGENLDVYKGASLNMNLDTPAGYRRAIQGFEVLAERMGDWDGTDQEIILSKLILSYARLSEAQDDPAALQKAGELAEAYLRERPNSVYLLVAGAETRVRSGQLQDARGYLNRLDATTNEDFYLFQFVQGLMRLQNNTPDLALVALRSAVEKNADFPLGHFSLGQAYEISRREADAVASYQEVIRLSPNHAAAHYQLARIELHKGNADEARRLAETAVAVGEEHLAARLLLAQLMLQSSENGAASRHAATVLELASPGRNDDLLVGAHIVQARVASERGDRDQARRHFELALQISPTNTEAREGLDSLASTARSAPAPAQRPTPVAARVEPRQPARKAPEPAKPAPKPAARPDAGADSKASLAAYQEGAALYQQGRARDAVPRLITAVKADQRNDKAWSLLGQIYIEVGMDAEAMKALQQAVRLNPRNAEAHVNLGGLYDARGDSRRAVEHYRTYLKLAPNGRFAGDIKALLAGRE